MTKEIIERQNDALKPGDVLYHVGDWAWGKASRLNAIVQTASRMRDDVTHHLILGNHDELDPFKYVDMGFTSVHTSLVVKVGDFDACLNHDPSAWTCLPKGMILVCGHVHGLFKAIPERRVVNVGVDVWDFLPVKEDQILAELGL
jgi:calcineurin-like phosphoesterase family protein